MRSLLGSDPPRVHSFCWIVASEVRMCSPVKDTSPSAAPSGGLFVRSMGIVALVLRSRLRQGVVGLADVDFAGNAECFMPHAVL